MIIAVLAQYMLVCFSKQLEDTRSSNANGMTRSPGGSLQEIGPTLSPCHMPTVLKDRHVREDVCHSIHMFSLEEFEV